MWCINCASDKTPAILNNKLLYWQSVLIRNAPDHHPSTTVLKAEVPLSHSTNQQRPCYSWRFSQSVCRKGVFHLLEFQRISRFPAWFHPSSLQPV
ncbi:hypothetical protein ATANTOWER_001916 [Ataeniobius toweri]|uniref:Uncharacterized protein n=1 Tax=Ataeniobius toweri TaxID=208326 RepID=A0ABU7BQ70_9TELE|nr:hypothetical protein [Ataeniobius toweri]